MGTIAVVRDPHLLWRAHLWWLFAQIPRKKFRKDHLTEDQISASPSTVTRTSCGAPTCVVEAAVSRKMIAACCTFG